MKTYIFNPAKIVLVVVLFLIIGCKKDEETLMLSRRFSPSTVTGTNGETSVKISWPSSLFTLPGEATYTIEVSKDLTFSTVDFTATTGDLSVVITDDKLAVKQDYFARVKALGKDGAAESNWSMSTAFRITGEQFLLPIPPTDIIDVSVIVRWKPNPGLTTLVLTPSPAGTPITISLTATDIAANSRTITGLTQTTSYSTEVFQGTKTKGIITFKTVASITGTNIINLSATTGNPALLQSTLIANPPSGSVIILRRGEQYVMSSSYSFNGSVKIVSALGFGTNYAIIRPTATFNVLAGATIDSLVFKDVIIKGGRAANASYTNDYVLNVNTASTIKLVRLEGCTIKILRGVVRGQGSPTRFNNLFINNSVVDSINDFSVVAVSNNSAFDNIRITNSTFYKSLKFINHNVASPAGQGSQSILIENCTFNEVVSTQGGTSNNYLIDYNASNVTGGITIRNCIFGKTWAAGGTFLQIGFRAGTATNLTVTNTYSTSDFTFSSSPLTGTLPYSAASTSLFTAPDVGNFLIKDALFAGRNSAGDPRWRIN